MFVSIHKSRGAQFARLNVTLNRRDMIDWTGSDNASNIRVHLYGNAAESLILEPAGNDGIRLTPITVKRAHDSLDNSCATCSISSRKANAAQNAVHFQDVDVQITRGKPIIIKLPPVFHGDGPVYRRTRMTKPITNGSLIPTPVAVLPMPAQKTAEEKLGTILRIAKAHNLSFDDAIKLLPILDKLGA